MSAVMVKLRNYWLIDRDASSLYRITSKQHARGASAPWHRKPPANTRRIMKAQRYFLLDIDGNMRFLLKRNFITVAEKRNKIKYGFEKRNNIPHSMQRSKKSVYRFSPGGESGTAVYKEH